MSEDGGIEEEHCQRTLTDWRAQREKQVKTGKENVRACGTHSLESVEGWKVRTAKGSEQALGTHFLESAECVTSQNGKRKRARGTHELESAEGGTCQDRERKQASVGHSLTGECKG